MEASTPAVLNGGESFRTGSPKAGSTNQGGRHMEVLCGVGALSYWLYLC
jgi:hypothetical protein